ncbi:MAG: amidophosphoribosyltransferase [Candidatus Firestonebacteria bacterium]
MGGFFGVVSKKDCVSDLFFGTDYHSHLGTKRGGMTTYCEEGFIRYIHDISNAQFRSKFDEDVRKMRGNMGIGVISDYEDQPLLITSHLGDFSIVTVGVIKNSEALVKKIFRHKSSHFAEMGGGYINPTELVAALINEENSFEAGIEHAQKVIEGSCSILVLTKKGLFAARDRLGRTPVILGKRPGAYAVTFETSAFPNLGYETVRDLGPGEIILISPEGISVKKKAGKDMQICSFLWVYYGYPSSDYEGINVEASRYRCGAMLANRDNVSIDMAAGIPDSGTAHAMGYSNEKKVPFTRPFVKYTPTWPRSFMPQDQNIRDLVAKMKLIPIKELIRGNRILFCEDSIVRGTQLKEIISRLYEYGAKEVHMRPACPPLVYGCKFLNFSRSRSVLDLAGRWAIKELLKKDINDPKAWIDPDSDNYKAMVEVIRKRLKLTTLQYQRLDDLVEAIGLPKEKLCTYCWDGCEKIK